MNAVIENWPIIAAAILHAWPLIGAVVGGLVWAHLTGREVRR